MNERLELLLGLNRLKDAEAAARDLIAAQPDSEDGYCGLARALAASGKHAEAAAACKDALRQNPACGTAFAVLAAAELGLGRHNPAMDAVREALRLFPDYPFATAVAADALCRRSEFNEAARFVDAGLRLSPHHESLLFWKGWITYQRKRYVEAETIARDGLKLHPTSSRLHNLLGCIDWTRSKDAILSRGRLARRADAAFAEALRLNPTDDSARDNRRNNALSARDPFLLPVGLGGVCAAAANGGVVTFHGHGAIFGLSMLFAAAWVCLVVMLAQGWSSRKSGIDSPLLRLTAPLPWLPTTLLTAEQRRFARRYWRAFGILILINAAFFGSLALFR